MFSWSWPKRRNLWGSAFSTCILCCLVFSPGWGTSCGMQRWAVFV